jgi:hypothetical protein
MTSNLSDRKTGRKCQRGKPREIEVVSATAFDAQDRLHRAYEFILLIAEQANQDRCAKATESQGEVSDG